MNERVVSIEDARALAVAMKFDGYYEVSALTGSHVAEPFFHFALSVARYGRGSGYHDDNRTGAYAPPITKISLSEDNSQWNKQKGGACCGESPWGRMYGSAGPPALPSVTEADKQGVDNVFADMEQSMQSVGSCVVWCIPIFDDMSIEDLCVNLVCCSCRTVGVAVTYVLILLGLFFVFLPAFFLLLMIRTTHVEHDTKAMDVRAAVMEQESACTKFLRKVSFLIKAMFRTFFATLNTTVFLVGSSVADRLL